MKISILCTDARHPIVPALREWRARQQASGHEVQLCHDRGELSDGVLLFLVSCSQLIGPQIRNRFEATLVLHASDLPKGRGWSPHIWAILAGAREITVTLLEASEPVDSGRIWLQERFELDGHELLPEINAKLFGCELSLMSAAVERYRHIVPVNQTGDAGAYLRRRTPEDSRLDPEQTLASQFDLLRVADSERFPAFFDYRGHRYHLKIEKANHD